MVGIRKLTQHNQECAPMFPDPFPSLRVGSGNETMSGTHPEIESRIRIQNGIESTLYHMYRERNLQRRPVSILKPHSQFSSN